LRVGAVLLPTDPWPIAVARARRLERLGYDHLWGYDHAVWRHYRDRPWHATYAWLAGLAASTARIRLGTMVANPSLRHPLLRAKDAMTIDHISGGRFTLGLGAGGTGFDATVLGQEPLTRAQRTARLEGFATLLDGLLRDEVTDAEGEWYTVRGARVLPPCVQQPRVPLAIAATGPRGLALTARLGDGWITWGDPEDPGSSGRVTEAAVRRQLDLLQSTCEAAGRDPATIDRFFLVGNSADRPLEGVEEFVDFAGRYEALGFTDLVFHDPRPDDPVWNEDPDVVDAIAEALGLADR